VGTTETAKGVAVSAWGKVFGEEFRALAGCGDGFEFFGGFGSSFHAADGGGDPPPTHESLEEFDGRIGRVGGWLASRGIGAGDVVAVLMKNSAAFLELVFATSHIGAVFLPINYRLSADEVSYIVGNSGARILIADEELADIATGDALVVLLDEAAQSGVARLAPGTAPAPMHPRQPRDLMRLMYTSGTTDRPKGVMLTYENIYWKSADQTLVLGLNAETRLLVVGLYLMLNAKV